MATGISSGLITKVTAITNAHGINPSSDDARTLTGTQETIKSKWFLGGRKVSYRMRCEFDEPAHIVRFREAAAESSWGVPPPTLTVEKTTQSGTRVSESRTDRSPGGGGHLDYGGVRDEIERAVRGDGWQFVFEAGRLP